MSLPIPPPTLFDSGSDLHAPELYEPLADDRPPEVATLADIGPREVEIFREHGCLVVRQAFTPAEIAAALDGLVHLIMGGNPEFTGIWFEAKAKEILSTLTPVQRQDAVRKIGDFVNHDARLKALSHHAALLAAVRTLLGCATPFMFQDMALVKPPRLGQ